jgi:hypothetical protein
MGKLVNMTRLSFKDTLVTGKIPTELGEMTILQNLSLEGNSLTGSAPKEVCTLRNLELNLFVTDCFDSVKKLGVDCPVADCCTFCRRAANTIPDFVQKPATAAGQAVPGNSTATTTVPGRSGTTAPGASGTAAPGNAGTAAPGDTGTFAPDNAATPTPGAGLGIAP